MQFAIALADQGCGDLQYSCFSHLDLAYVYEIIDAYRELWVENAPLPWNELWGHLLALCENVVRQERFWAPESAERRTHFVANRYWIVGVIARLIEIGTASDAFPEKCLQQAEEILLIMLQRERGSEFKLDDDAVSVAINSPRGRCIEALIHLTLHACRSADKRGAGHVNTWNHFQPIYDAELTRAENNEYEAVTLVARYRPNFLWMSKDWVVTNFDKLFNTERYQKWLCAIQGYAHLNRVYDELYDYLKQNNHFIRTLDDEHINQKIRGKIVQNIAVMYLSDHETLEDKTSLIIQLLERKRHPEIRELIWFLWTLRESGNAKIRGKVLELWPLIVKVIDTSTSEGKQLASNLCDWAVFIDEVDDINRPLILAVAPYADENHHSYELLENVARISERQPLEAHNIWRRMLENGLPGYPSEAIQRVLANLVKLGPDGIRKAKENVSEYIKGGNEEPFRLLTQLLDLLKTP